PRNVSSRRAFFFATASSIDVGAPPNRYFTPRRCSSSRIASPTVSTASVFLVIESPSLEGVVIRHPLHPARQPERQRGPQQEHPDAHQVGDQERNERPEDRTRFDVAQRRRED